MDGKLGTFLMGVIAAVVLALLWKKDCGCKGAFFSGAGQRPGVGAGSGVECGSCATDGMYAASPAMQSSLSIGTGTEGMISPGAPPLNSVTGYGGATSFYTNAGVTPDSSFTFLPVAVNPLAVGTPKQPPAPNTPGSATTPAALTPTRAIQAVPTYYELGFIPRYSVSGVYVH